MKKSLFIIVVTVFILTNVNSQDYSFKETFDIQAPAQLSILTSDGDVNVKPTDKNEIEIFFTAKKKGKMLDITKEELLEYHTLEITQTANSLAITAKPKYKNMPQTWSHYIVLSFDVYVPSETSCNLKTSDGDIYVASVKGEQKCKSSDGDIHGIDIIGNMEVGTSDGDIKLKDCVGNLNAKTSDGNIMLDNMKGDLYTKTSDGNINFQHVTGAITGITSDGRINGEIESIDNQTELKTGDGGIHLVLPKNSGFDIEMRGNRLSADFSEFNGDICDDYIAGKVNGGGKLIKLATSDGRINLDFQ
jgi:hypothetical protein